MAPRSQQSTTLRITFYSCNACFICQAAIFVLILWQSKWHAVSGCPSATSSPCWETITPTQRNEQGCSPGARLPGRPTPLLRHLSSLFAKVRARSAELFTSNCLAGSGCRCYCFCVWFCLLAQSFLSPLHVVSAGCQGAWRVSF